DPRTGNARVVQDEHHASHVVPRPGRPRAFAGLRAGISLGLQSAARAGQVMRVGGPTLIKVHLPLVLASQSPRRKELLSILGCPCTIGPANINESPAGGESPE